MGQRSGVHRVNYHTVLRTRKLKKSELDDSSFYKCPACGNIDQVKYLGELDDKTACCSDCDTDETLLVEVPYQQIDMFVNCIKTLEDIEDNYNRLNEKSNEWSYGNGEFSDKSEAIKTAIEQLKYKGRLNEQ